MTENLLVLLSTAGAALGSLFFKAGTSELIHHHAAPDFSSSNWILERSHPGPRCQVRQTEFFGSQNSRSALSCAISQRSCPRAEWEF
jgi:hypothetical protein